MVKLGEADSRKWRHVLNLKKMKKVILILLAVIGFGIMANAQESKPRIAVIELSAIGESRKLDHNAQELTSILTTRLVKKCNYRYNVAERSSVEKIIKELGLQSTQEANVRAAEIGKLLGAHKIITGEYARKTINIRLINVESGNIENAAIIKNEFSKQALARKLIRRLKLY